MLESYIPTHFVITEDGMFLEDFLLKCEETLMDLDGDTITNQNGEIYVVHIFNLRTRLIKNPSKRYKVKFGKQIKNIIVYE